MLGLQTAPVATAKVDLIELSLLLTNRETLVLLGHRIVPVQIWMPVSPLSCMGGQQVGHKCPLVVDHVLVLNPEEGSDLGLGS